VRHRRDVEQLARPQLDDAPVVERGRRDARDDEPDVLDRSPRRPDRRPDVLRPSPPRLIGRTADGDAGQSHDLESALRHLPDFIGSLKAANCYFGEHMNLGIWRSEDVEI
jgi:hypothetical protein